MSKTVVIGVVFLICMYGVILTGNDVAHGAARVDADPLIAGLARPVAIVHSGDGSDRLFIVLKEGRIVIYKKGALLDTPFLDIRSLVSNGGEQGLLGLVFHPTYTANAYFYVNYTNTDGNTVVARYTVSEDTDRADAQSGTTILNLSQPFGNHNAGDLQFGPDGFLYIGTGDGGGSGDPKNQGQSLNTLLGKMLRIDVDSGDPYAIPPDNPFVNEPNIREEIWAYGLRNPWRYSFDSVTGDLFIADVGQGAWEEVNVLPAQSDGGQNFGWKFMEGPQCFDPPQGCKPEAFEPPILAYSHSFGCSVTGGFRHRGNRYPALNGRYFYGDYCSGRIWAGVEDEQGLWSAAEIANTPFLISTFGKDGQGELLVANYHGSNGAIYGIYDHEVGPRPGWHEEDVRINNPVEFQINISNTRGIAPEDIAAEWLVAAGILAGEQTDFFFATPSGLVSFNAVTDLSSVIYNFDHGAGSVHTIESSTLGSSGYELQDIVAYAYVFRPKGSDEIIMENGVVIRVVP